MRSSFRTVVAASLAYASAVLAMTADPAAAQVSAQSAQAAPAPVQPGATAATAAAPTPAPQSTTGAPVAATPPSAGIEVPGWLQRQWATGWATVVALFNPPQPSSLAKGGQPPGPPPTVTTSNPIQRAIVEWDEYTGRFDAVDTVEIRARISGYLLEAHFKDGQLVRKGDPLYSIDPRPFERALDQANAELALSKTRILNAVKDVDRARPLVKNRVITEKTFDDRENLYEDAQAQAKVAEAKVKSAELDLSFTKITSPIEGRISRSAVSVGNYVIGGAANGSLLTTIVTQSPIQIYFDINENNLIKYKRLSQQGQSVGSTSLGMKVEFALPDDKQFPFAGTLDFVDNRLDVGTSTLRVRAIVENKDGLFSPGMFARVRIPSSARYDALLLPDEAIGTDQTNRFVYVVGDDGTAQRRPVELGGLHDNLRVVRGGLKADDWVIVRGVQRARPGIKLTPKREALQVSTAPVPPPMTAKP